ncbi:hypothetical protein HMN09_00357100 [Mycena chlorophos]|uniref:F-box domain-containing protein n=1 Tax=Mycena chlorophos TaxID=658473 RepID=A0A8H6WH58_MYCCL|nr:hypothetical protein HMN09_00357100 [Mycena chlorophos]
MSTTKLPQEILESIVPFLDTRSLGACLLAGRCFRIACEAELFRSVVLREDPSRRPNRYTGWNAAHKAFINDCVFVASSRHLARFVEGLTIELNKDPSVAKLLEMVLVRVAGTLKRLELVVAAWALDIPDGLVEAVLDVMGRAQLERIELGCQHGRGHLDFLCKAIADQRPGIDRVDWRKVHATILVDEWNEYSLRSWSALLSLLTTLTIRWDDNRYPSYLTEYPILSQLRALTLQFTGDDATTVRLDARQGQLLSLLPTLAPALETLRFEIGWTLDWDPDSEQGVPWPSLGPAEFSFQDRKKAFPALERCECAHTIRWWHPSWGVEEREFFAGWLLDWTDERLAGPVKAGILDVSLVVLG